MTQKISRLLPVKLTQEEKYAKAKELAEIVVKFAKIFGNSLSNEEKPEEKPAEDLD